MATLHGLVTENIGRYGSELAVVYDDTKSWTMMSYHDLGCQMKKLKSEFCKLDVSKKVVGVMLSQSFYLPAVLLGLLDNECPFVPLSLSGERYTAEVLAAAGVSYVLVDNSRCQELTAVLNYVNYEEKISQKLQSFDLRLLHIKRIPESIGNSYMDHKKPQCSGLAYCITTSGTTSKPKVVKVPHSCITPNIVHLRQIFKLRPGDKVLMTSPLTFDPSIVDIFCTLSCGACLVMVPPDVKQSPEKLLQIINHRQRITVLQATPSIMRTLGPERLKQTVLGPDSNLRLLALGGEQFPRASELSSWLGSGNKTKLINLYGITEVSCWASCHQVDRESLLQQDGSVSIGEVLDETLIKLSPIYTEQVPDDGTVSPGQKVGEILIGSASRVCTIGDEQLQTSFESKVVWRRTGDLGMASEDGNIYCLGRLDNQIKRLGKRMNLSAVEQVIEELPEVHSCRAVYHRMTLAAFVLLEQSADSMSSPDTETRHLISPHAVSDWSSMEAKLLAHARRLLPSHAVPDVFVEILDQFPLTSHGKLNIQELQRYLEIRESVSPDVSSSSVLQNLWKDHLPVSQQIIQGSDNFLSSGGDSLSAVRLATNLEAVSSLSMAHIYDILVNKDFHSLQKAMVEMSSHDVSINQEKRSNLYTSRGFSNCKNRVSWKDNSLVATNEKEAFKFRSVLNEGKNGEDQKCIVSNGNSFSFKRKIESTSQSEKGFERRGHVKRRKLCSFNEDTEAPKTIIQRGGKILSTANYLDAHCDNQCENEDSLNEELTYTERCDRTNNTHQNLARLQEKGMHLHLKWKFDTKKCVDASPLILECRSQSSVFIGSHSGLVSCLNLVTGMCAWSVRLPERVESSACCTLDGCYVILGCYDGNIYTLCASSGAVAWRFSTGDSVKCSPTLNPVSENIICGSHDGCLYCLDTKIQQCVWKRHLGGGSVFASPAVDPDGLSVYTATLGGFVLALDAATGEIKWRTNLQKPVFASPYVNDGSLLVGCVDSRLYCVDTASGVISWSFQALAPIFSSPVVYERHILFGSHDFSVYCLNPDGCLLWTFKTHSTIYATVFPFQCLPKYSVQDGFPGNRAHMETKDLDKLMIRNEKTDSIRNASEIKQEAVMEVISVVGETLPAVEVPDKEVFNFCIALASTDGKICVLDGRDGHLLIENEMPGQIFSSPVVAKNHIIAGCRDNYVYCFEITMGASKEG